MLAYILAIVVGLGSLAFMSAFFFVPQVHRQSDFVSGALGLFFAWVMWVCAGRMTGAVLLGQLAGVVALLALGWQVVKLRWETIPADDRVLISRTNAIVPLLAQISPEVWLERLATSRSHSPPTPTPTETAPEPTSVPPEETVAPETDTEISDRGEETPVSPPPEEESPIDPGDDGLETAIESPSVDEPEPEPEPETEGAIEPEVQPDTTPPPSPTPETNKKGLFASIVDFVRGIFSRQSSPVVSESKTKSEEMSETSAVPEMAAESEETPETPAVLETETESVLPLETHPIEEIAPDSDVTDETTATVSEEETSDPTVGDEKPKDSD